MKAIQQFNHTLFKTISLWFERLENRFDGLGRKLF